MPNYKIIKMTNMSPMHIGLGRDSYDVSAGTLHSDTITAALAAIRAVQGKTEDLKQFLESFALSSAFPYCGDMLFLPKPSGRLNVTVSGLDEKDYRKLLKKVKFIAHTLWTRIVSGDAVEVNRLQLHGEYLLEQPTPSFEPPMKSVINQRVAVPRTDGEDAKPFAFEWTFFRPKCGLFCLLDAPQTIADEVVSLFEELGEQGLGSDRNVGGGHFGVNTESELEIPQIEGANSTMALSMFIPQQDEVESLNVGSSRFQLAKRGGFIAGSSLDSVRHLRKNAIHMFTAGSVFNCVETLKGKVVDLRPQWKDGDLHPVYRSGKALSINIKTSWL